MIPDFESHFLGVIRNLIAIGCQSGSLHFKVSAINFVNIQKNLKPSFTVTDVSRTPTDREELIITYMIAGWKIHVEYDETILDR